MLFIAVLLMLASFFYPYFFWKKGKMFELGFSVAGSYFLMLPGFFLVMSGVLPVPIDFFWTEIPKINFDIHKAEIILVLVFWLVVNQINVFLSAIKFKGNRLSRANLNDGVFIRIFFVYEALSFLLFFASGLGSGGSHWSLGKEEFMKETGTLGLIFVFMVAGSRYAFVALATLSLFQEKKRLIACLTLIVCSITDLYMTGNRITMLLVLFCFMYYLLKNKEYKIIGIGCLVALPFGWFMVIFRFIRSQLHSESSVLEGFSKGLDVASGMLDFNSGVVFEFMSGISESVNFNVLIGVYTRYGSGVDYLSGSSYWKALVWWVPRSLYEGKPETITLEVAKVFAPHEHVSLVATALGESFANFGYFSAVLLPFILFGFRSIVEKLYVSERYCDFVKLVYGFLLFRMAFSDLFVYMIFGGLLVIALNFKFRFYAH